MVDDLKNSEDELRSKIGLFQKNEKELEQDLQNRKELIQDLKNGQNELSSKIDLC